MRGFGTPQSHFAIESMMDILSSKLKIDALELRERNVICPGDRQFTRMIVDYSAKSLKEIINHAKVQKARLKNKKADPGKRYGVGVALAIQPMGYGARVPDVSSHRLVWLPDGRVRIFLGSTDMGQGLSMVAEQITAEALGLPYDAIESVTVDTSISPNGNTSSASRMTYMVGNAMIIAAEKLKDKLLDYASSQLRIARENLLYKDGMIIKPDGDNVIITEFLSRAAEEGVEIKSEATFSFPNPEGRLPNHLPFGMPHLIYCYGGQVAGVEVDSELGTVDVTDLIAINDPGRVISKSGIEGQIEGGVAMGLGYALFENMLLKDDGNWVDNFSEYLIPSAKDMPSNLQKIILELPENSGPFGARGIGEIVMVPTAPAIANAVFDAVGIRVNKLPITPEDLIRVNE